LYEYTGNRFLKFLSKKYFVRILFRDGKWYKTLGVAISTIDKWVKRFKKYGAVGLKDKQGQREKNYFSKET